MKKITTLLMAMVGWLFAVNASADSYVVESTPTAASALESGTYVLRAKCNNFYGYVTYDAACSVNRKFHLMSVDAADATDLLYVWNVVKKEDGTITLQNYKAGVYMPIDAAKNKNFTGSTNEDNANAFTLVTDSTTGTVWTDGDVEAVVFYDADSDTDSSTGEKEYVHANDDATHSCKNLSYWPKLNLQGTTVQFLFYKVSDITESATTTVTYNVVLNGTTLSTVTVDEVAIGSTAAVPSSVEASYYYGTPAITSASSDASNLTVAEDNATFNVTYSTTTTLATEPTAAADLTNGTYVLKVAAGDLDTTGYFNHVATCGANRNFHLTSGDVDITDSNYLWRLVKTGAGFTLQNVGTGAYVPADAATNKNMQTATTADHAAVLVADPIEGGKLTNGIALYDANNQVDGANLYIYKNGHTDGSTYANGSYWTNKNVNGAMVQFAFYKVTETAAEAIPFDETKVYTIKFRNSDACYATHTNATDANVNTNQSMDSWTKYKGGLWKFEKSGLGVKLYNYAHQKYVTVSSSANGAVATLDETGTAFIVKTNSNGGFSLQYPGASVAHLGDHASSRLGIWNYSASQNDGGSNFGIEEASLDKAKELLNADIAGTATGDIYNDNNYLVYVANSESIEAAKTAVESANSIDDLLSTEVSASFAPEEGVYYQIFAKYYATDASTNIASFITSGTIAANAEGTLDTSLDGSNNRRITRATASDALVPQLWQFENSATDGYYKIKSANHGLYFGQVTAYDACIEMPIAEAGAGAYALQKGQDSQYALLVQSDGHMLNAHGGASANIVADWNGNSVSDNGSNWVIKKVTEVPVAISDAGYTTVNFPFAVTIPAESGVTAYYASTVDQTTMQLTELGSSVIPANTPVILGHDGATTVSLTIGGEAESVEGNLLSGTTAKRSGFEADATYGLAKNAAGNACFLQNETTTVPANKAYLLTSALPTEGAAQTLNFRFGSPATGINSAAAAEGSNTYYDLSGRRVLYPANGIFVTGSGKKVFIK